MPTYEVSCPDGTDPGCYKTVEVELDEIGLSSRKAASYIKDNDIDVDSCPACGSDYTRDSDGRIVD